jgi:hypothetical protein
MQVCTFVATLGDRDTQNIFKTYVTIEITGFAQHIFSAGHRYGSINNNMTIIKTAKNGQYMNSLEKFYIQKL